MTKYTLDGNVKCPYCGFKNHFYGNSIKKCKHLTEAHYDNVKFKQKWVFDKAGRGFNPTFTIKHTTPEENKNVRSKYQMSKFVR